MVMLGILIAIGAAVAFAVLGLLTLWGGFNTLGTEVPRDYVRTAASGGTRLLTTALVGLPLVITGIFGILAGVRILQMAAGM